MGRIQLGDLVMSDKPTYEGLERRVKALAKEAVTRKQAEEMLRIAKAHI